MLIGAQTQCLYSGGAKKPSNQSNEVTTRCLYRQEQIYNHSSQFYRCSKLNKIIVVYSICCFVDHFIQTTVQNVEDTHFKRGIPQWVSTTPVLVDPLSYWAFHSDLPVLKLHVPERKTSCWEIRVGIFVAKRIRSVRFLVWQIYQN